MECDVSPNSPKKKGRKRKFPSQNKSEGKKLCNNNEAYISLTNGNVIKPKSFSAIKLCCSLKCFQKFSEKEQEKIFERYNHAGSCEMRFSFIFLNVEEVPIKTSTTLKDVSNKSTSRIYRLNHIKVCKKFFIQLLQISGSRIDTALSKGKQMYVQDNRGRHENHLKLPPETLQYVKDHINKFPKYISHYKRETSTAYHSTLCAIVLPTNYRIKWK